MIDDLSIVPSDFDAKNANDVMANIRWVKNFRKLIYMRIDIYVIDRL